MKCGESSYLVSPQLCRLFEIHITLAKYSTFILSRFYLFQQVLLALSLSLCSCIISIFAVPEDLPILPIAHSQHQEEGKKKGHLDKMKGMHDGISSSIPQQHEDKVTDQIERGKYFLRKYLGRRDQFIYRGERVCIRFSYVISVLISILTRIFL